MAVWISYLSYSVLFHADILCSYWHIFHTKFKYKIPKGNNSKIRRWRVMVLVQYTSKHLRIQAPLLLHTEIYTALRFHNQICNSLWDIVPTSLWRTDMGTDEQRRIFIPPPLAGDNEVIIVKDIFHTWPNIHSQVYGWWVKLTPPFNTDKFYHVGQSTN